MSKELKILLWLVAAVIAIHLAFPVDEHEIGTALVCTPTECQEF